MLQLPRWEGREWSPVFDSARLAPYDALVADDELPAEEVAAARAAAAMYAQEHAWPVLPWSCVVLESVPAGTVGGAERARAKPGDGDESDGEGGWGAPAPPPRTP